MNILFWKPKQASTQPPETPFSGLNPVPNLISIPNAPVESVAPMGVVEKEPSVNVPVVVAPVVTAPVVASASTTSAVELAQTARELVRVQTMASELQESIVRLEQQGKDTAHLRQALVFLSDDPLKFQMMHDPRWRPFTLLSTETLRTVARSCDISSRCIAHLKSEVSKVPLKIVAKDPNDQSASTQKRIKDATQWFSKSGGLGGVGVCRSVFEAQLIDDLMNIGAYSVHKSYATRGDRLDGLPSEIKAIDAATIRPLVTPFGFPVGDDAPAFEQWVLGVPSGLFFRDEMIYEGLPSFARTDSPYFMSPTEMAAMQIFTLLKVDQWNREWLTEGSGYRRWFKANDSLTPAQAKDWLEIVTMQTQGNAAERHGLGIIPGEITGDESRKDQDFDNYESSRIDRICLAYGVNPASIGQHGRTFKDSQEGAMDSTREGTVAELLLWREEFYNCRLDEMGWDMLCVTEDKPAPNESPAERSSRQAGEIAGGVKTPNQVQAENGGEPVEGGDELLVPGTLKPLSQVLAPPAAPEIAPGAAGPDNGSDVLPEANTGAETERSAQSTLQRGDKSATQHEFGCVMVHPRPLSNRAKAVWDWAKAQNLSLVKGGIDDTPHVTVLYGLHTPDPGPIADIYRDAAASGQGTMRAKIGPLALFRSRGKEGKDDYDVLVHQVESSDLRAMNGRLRALDHTSTFPDYKPHMTVAYVAPGSADHLEGQPGPLTGQEMNFDQLTFSNADGQEFAIDGQGNSVLHDNGTNPDSEPLKRLLRQWERKCINRLDRNRSHLVDFDSEALSDAVRDQVLRGLAAIDVPERCAIRDLFTSVIEGACC